MCARNQESGRGLRGQGLEIGGEVCVCACVRFCVSVCVLRCSLRKSDFSYTLYFAQGRIGGEREEAH